MIDFTFITVRLATGGGIADAADLTMLEAHGITHIIVCRAAWNDAILLKLDGVAYLWNGTWDDGMHKPIEWFQTSPEFALPALVWNCHRGSSNSSVNVAAWPWWRYGAPSARPYSDGTL